MDRELKELFLSVENNIEKLGERIDKERVEHMRDMYRRQLKSFVELKEQVSSTLWEVYHFDTFLLEKHKEVV